MAGNRRLVVKWALGGLLLGLVLVAVDWTIAALTRDTGESVMSAIGHRPNLWVINALPVILALIATIIGGAHAQLAAFRLKREISPSEWPRSGRPVRADEQRFRQILIKLVSNALKYTAEGVVKIRSYNAGDLILYEIADTGAGISPEDMPKVFTAFEQTDAVKGRVASTGLGLPVSLGMAQAMGGTIQADSLGAGHGSTFRLVLNAGSGEETELKMATLPQLLEI